MTRVLRRLADGGEIFQVKERFGRSMITALARLDGHVVGFVANQPIQKGGACDAEGCDKAVSFLALCDSFNIPLVFLHDVPGFFIGRDAERKRVAGKIITWMDALGMVTVPRVSIIVRKTYGQWELDTLPYGAAARHLIDEVIDPADTRDVVVRFLAQARTRSAIGRHRLGGWPTKF